MRWANMEEALLEDADLQRARMDNTGLEYAKLGLARMQGASLRGARLEGAELGEAQLQNAILTYAKLTSAWLSHAHLEGAQIYDARMGGATFAYAIVNGATWIHDSQVDAATDFRGVSLGAMRIDPGTKQLLEYNIRRMNWEDWYEEQHWSLRWLVRKFWQISDYGISTKQIIKTFFKLAFVFAIIYYIWGFIDYYLVGIKDYPGIVSDLFVLEDYQEAVSCWLVPFRAVYFSVVTMTTLGFGDMYANAHSFFRGLFGHALLALQVILGYVLLGALVTRFAVLFTAGGPAGTFANEKKNRNKTAKKIKN
ncbi:hypothetical protein ES703_58178 [subsurface metagenome]